MKNPNGYGSVDRMKGKRRRPYRVRITEGYEVGEDGKARQIQRTLGFFATYEEAVEALAAYNQDPVSLDPTITFAEVYKRWSEKRFGETRNQTHRNYQSAFRAVPMLHDLEFRKIRTVHLQNAIDTCGKKIATLNQIVVVIGGMYEYAIQNDIASRDYSRYISLERYRKEDKERKRKAPPVHKPFTEEELAALWDRADDPFVRELLMLCYSGLRIKEYLELRPESVDVPGRFLSVEDSKTESGIRRVPIAEKTAAFWQELMDRRRANPDPRVTQAQYAEFEENMIAKCEELGIQRHLPHDTRHTAATVLKKRKADLFYIKKILGHKIDDLTERVYTHVDPADLLAAINLM